MLQRQMGDRPRVYLETVYSKFEQTPFSGFLVHHMGSYWKEAGHQFLSHMLAEISAAKGKWAGGGGQEMTWCYGFDIDGCSP